MEGGLDVWGWRSIRFKLYLQSLYTLCHILSHRQVEDEYVGGAPHRLVEDDNEDDQEVPDEPDDDHQGEDDGHLDTDRDYGDQFRYKMMLVMEWW